MRRRFHPFVIAHAVLALTACKAEDCEPGFAEGEQFQITITEKTSAEGINCEAEHPEFLPEDSFILEGGQLFDPGHSKCDPVRGAKADPPAPWSEEVHECESLPLPLGQTCEWKDGCGGFIKIHVDSDFAAGRSTEDGTLVVRWSRYSCAGGEASECTERYPVSIERL